MKPIIPWIKAARFRTLPLSAGGIILGGFLAAYEYSFSGITFILALLTAILLQILSNLANDYGDFLKGTDQAAGRTDRALASGLITPAAMKKSLWVVGTAIAIMGLSLVLHSFRNHKLNLLTWIFIGITAIAVAIMYTIGRKPYGYMGLGDIIVLIFFGPVAVVGTYTLMTGNTPGNIWVPSFGFGLLCVAVLNINNLRDIESDRKSNKMTLAVRLGYKGAIWYQYGLFTLAIFLFVLFSRVSSTPFDQFVAIIFGILYYLIALKLSKQPLEPGIYNSALKRVSLLNLLLVIILGIFWLN